MGTFEPIILKFGGVIDDTLKGRAAVPHLLVSFKNTTVGRTFKPNIEKKNCGLCSSKRMTIEVRFTAGRDKGSFFDQHLSAVRTARAYLPDAEVAAHLISEREVSPENAWLLIHSSRIPEFWTAKDSVETVIGELGLNPPPICYIKNMAKDNKVGWAKVSGGVNIGKPGTHREVFVGDAWFKAMDDYLNVGIRRQNAEKVRQWLISSGTIPHD